MFIFRNHTSVNVGEETKQAMLQKTSKLTEIL